MTNDNDDNNDFSGRGNGDNDGQNDNDDHDGVVMFIMHKCPLYINKWGRRGDTTTNGVKSTRYGRRPKGER